MNKAENPEYYAKIVDGEVKYVKKHKKTAFDVVLYIFFGLFGLLGKCHTAGHHHHRGHHYNCLFHSFKN